MRRTRIGLSCALAVLLLAGILLPACSKPDTSTEEVVPEVESEHIAPSDYTLSPMAGSPIACPCGQACEDSECREAQRAFNLGLYPWLAIRFASGDSALHQSFLSLPKAQYATISELMTGKPMSIGFSSVFLNSLYNGPSSLSLKHFYEYIIMEWLAYENSEMKTTSIPSRVLSGANAVMSFATDMEESDVELDAELNKLARQWDELTGEAIESSPSSSVGVVDRFGAAISGATDMFGYMSDGLERWALVSSVYDTSLDKIELLELAVETSDNEDFVAAGQEVVDSYRRAVREDSSIDWSFDSLAQDQVQAYVVDVLWDQVWGALGDSNPFISTAQDVLDLAFNTGDSADANMSLLGAYIVGAELRLGLTESLSSLTNDLPAIYEGRGSDSASRYVRCFRAYIDYEMYAVDESVSWAEAVRANPFADQGAADTITSSALEEKNARASILQAANSAESRFWELEDLAINGACTCDACADQDDSEARLSQFVGRYRREGDTERAWSSFEVAQIEGGLSFSHESEHSYRMFSLTNYQPVNVQFEDGSGATSVESVDYGDANLVITLNEDNTFVLSCGIEGLDGTYVPEGTPLSTEELQSQEEEDEGLYESTLSWLTDGEGAWINSSSEEPVYLSFEANGSLKWLYGYGGVGDAGSYSLDGDNLTLAPAYPDGQAFCEPLTYIVRRFTSEGGDSRRIRLDFVSGDATMNFFEGWYDSGERWY